VKKTILLYLPVFHAGYLKLLQEHSDATHIYLIGQKLIGTLSSAFPEEISLRSLDRDPRCLSSRVAQNLLSALIPQSKVLTLDSVPENWLLNFDLVVMPDEQVCRFLYAQFSGCFGQVEFVQTFVRWDMPQTVLNRPVDADRTLTMEQFIDQGYGPAIQLAEQEARKSSDFWRQVGAVLMRGREILLATSNRHLPTEYAPLLDGDPRSNFQAGEFIEFSTAIHAEAGLIALAARQGIQVKGLEVYADTFPCPACANMLAVSGIGVLFFHNGYSNVAALSILREHGVEIVHVQ
jgi:dCMP deaminase